MVKIKTRRHPRELLVMIIAVAASVFMFHSRFYKTKSQQIVKSTEKIGSLKSEIQKNQTLIADLKTKVGDMSKKVEQAQNEKPTRYLSELINEFGAKDSGVFVNSYTTRETPVENSIWAVNVDLDVESSFLDLATLLERLEEKYHFLEFRKVDTNKDQEFLQKVKSTVSLSIYLDKERN